MSRVEVNLESRGLQAGDVIAERYRLATLVGEGGMGAVWRARHLQLDSDVALKLMSPAIAAQPDALSRFLREARAAARLSSLHVVKVFDYGVDGKTPFIVMELLTGESLRERLDREGAQPPERALWMMRHAARALSKAHAEGIVHRDLKPENLFVAQQEEEIVKVLDFGVAKLAGPAPAAPSMNTRTGAVLGTPFYMSPEQARGIKALDHRSDLWSLGVITFECLTGRLPFDSEAFGDLVLKICTLPPPVPSAIASVPAGFDAWFARAVEREPEQRYQTADEMAGALEQVLGGVAQSAPGFDSAASGQRRGERGIGARLTPAKGAVHALGGTHIDVTASQSVAEQIPKHGLGPLTWSLSVLGLVGLALAAFLLWGRSGAPEAASGPQAPMGAELPAVRPSPAEKEPASPPSPSAAAVSPTGGTPHLAAPVATRGTHKPSAAREPVRPRAKPPAPAPAAAAKPSGGNSSVDLFSDPD